MFTRQLPDADRYDRIATLDVETTGLEASESELVAVGVGYYEAGREEADVALVTRKHTGNDERAVVERAYEWVNDRDPECLVTYNGDYFDLPYLDARSEILGVDASLACRDRHVDLMVPRKEIAARNGENWPSLETVLDSYGIPTYSVTWAGRKLTNEAFGAELGPRYLRALDAGDDAEAADLEATVREYARSDVEANVAIYEADAGREFVPGHVE